MFEVSKGIAGSFCGEGPRIFGFGWRCVEKHNEYEGLTKNEMRDKLERELLDVKNEIEILERS